MSHFAPAVENLVKLYTGRGKPPVRALDGVRFTVAPGIIFGLLGPNGAGKSTLLRILTTLSTPTEGTARVFGWDVVRKPLEVRRRICFLRPGVLRLRRPLFAAAGIARAGGWIAPGTVASLDTSGFPARQRRSF